MSILAAVGGASTATGRILTGTTSLISNGGPTCATPMTRSVDWTTNSTVNDDYTLKIYRWYSTDGINYISDGLIHTENSPKSTETFADTLYSYYKASGDRTWYKWRLDLYNPASTLIQQFDVSVYWADFDPLCFF